METALQWEATGRDNSTLPRDLTATASGYPTTRGLCPSVADGYYCTRLNGHTGRHAAGDSRHIVAVWA